MTRAKRLLDTPDTVDETTAPQPVHGLNSGITFNLVLPPPKKARLSPSKDTDKEREVQLMAGQPGDAEPVKMDLDLPQVDLHQTISAAMSTTSLLTHPAQDHEISESRSSSPMVRVPIDTISPTPSFSCETQPTSITSGSIKDSPDPSTAPAGHRFWHMLNGKPDPENPKTPEMPDRLETFFQDLFSLEIVASAKTEPVIRPFYRQGKIGGYIRAGEKHVVEQDNFKLNISAMLVNKEFRAAASRISYGEPVFTFEDPINCQWWFKHIGELNFSNVRALTVDVQNGWPGLPMDDIQGVDLSQEEHWYRFFTWLKSRHQLTNLNINLQALEIVRWVCPLDLHRQEQLSKYRNKIRDVLWKFRGLEQARIFDPNEVLFYQSECNEYSMMMIQDRKSAFPPEPVVKTTIAEFLVSRRDALAMERLLDLDEETETCRQEAEPVSIWDSPGEQLAAEARERRAEEDAAYHRERHHRLWWKAGSVYVTPAERAEEERNKKEAAKKARNKNRTYAGHGRGIAQRRSQSQYENFFGGDEPAWQFDSY